MDMSHWALLMAFDVMGSVGFGQDWGAVRDGRENPVLRLLDASIAPTARYGSWTWPLKILSDLEASPEMNAFRKWSRQTMSDRRKAKDQQQIHLAGPLLESYEASARTANDDALLQVEGETAITAATHTTANTTVWVFYHAAKDQHLQQGILDELRPLFGEQEPAVMNNKLAKLPLLNALVDECLRLYNSVGLSRARVRPAGRMSWDQNRSLCDMLLWPGSDATFWFPQYLF